MYGALATACGYTFPEIDAMTMSEANMLMDYWREFPPAHILLRARWMPRETPRRGDSLAHMLGADPDAGGVQTLTVH